VKRTLPLALYAAATGLLEPLAPLALRRRARDGKEYAHRLNERLGRPALPRPDGPLVWLHGVSVGESLSLLPLIDALKARRPDLHILVTSGTVSSAEVLARRLPDDVLHQFTPVDSPRAVARFLDHWRPGAGLFVESELWPNLLMAAKRRGVRLALLSARMGGDSARGWARAPASARALLSAFDLVLPQDDLTAERLGVLGADVGPELNLKLTGPPPPVDTRLLGALRWGTAGRKVVLAASTHPGEDGIIARAFRAMGERGALLIVAPRHPDRSPALAAELQREGFKVVRRITGRPIEADTTAYILDSLGELGAAYTVADVVVMGGSFVPGVGGHNPMEAARLGSAIITGPRMENAADIYGQMFADVAAIEAADSRALTRHMEGLLTCPAIARRIGAAALAYAERQGAALATAMSLIEPLLPA
jgi:3-deoxy-D-manno-octulosonic-acid transferase